MEISPNTNLHHSSSLAQARTLVQELKSWLLSKVTADSLCSSSRIPFKAMSLREPLLYRMVELGDASCRLYEEKKMASAFTLTRSALETASMLYWLHMKMKQTIELKEVPSDLESMLKRALLGRKDKDVLPINVQTFINHVDNEFGVVKAMYDDLSEYAHPNWFGVMSLYGRPSPDRQSLLLGWQEHGAREGEGVPLLCAALELFKFYHQATSDALPSFIAICSQKPRRESGPC